MTDDRPGVFPIGFQRAGCGTCNQGFALGRASIDLRDRSLARAKHTPTYGFGRQNHRRRDLSNE